MPMVMALFGYWIVGFAAAVFLAFFTALAGVGVWFGLAIGLVVTSALLLWRWHRREKLRLVPFYGRGADRPKKIAAGSLDAT